MPRTNRLKVPAYKGAMSRWLAWYPPAHIPNNPRLRVIMTTPRVWLQPTNPSMTRNTPANIKPGNKIQLLPVVDPGLPRLHNQIKGHHVIWGFSRKTMKAMWKIIKNHTHGREEVRVPLATLPIPQDPPIITMYILLFLDKLEEKISIVYKILLVHKFHVHWSTKRKFTHLKRYLNDWNISLK